MATTPGVEATGATSPTITTPTTSLMPTVTPPTDTLAASVAPMMPTSGTVGPAIATAVGVPAGFTSAHLLPPIHPYYGGEQKDGETFQDWLEHFETVSKLARWDDHYKLVHLTTSLRGSAKSFYRSCAPTQRSDYKLLITELTKRFTPVRLPAVQTQIFHDRHQGAKETVDEFVQELRKLYAKAYAAVAYGMPEAEEVGQRVLASQFVTGLRAELKSKVVGMEGKVDELVVKARFEEAKSKELGTPEPLQRKTVASDQTPPMSDLLVSGNRPPRWPSAPQATPQRTTNNSRQCYNCGMAGHLAHSCPYPKPFRKDAEATGRSVFEVSVEEGADKNKGKIKQLRRELREAEVAEAIDETSREMVWASAELKMPVEDVWRFGGG